MKETLLGVGGVVSAVGGAVSAIAASTCCILPLALVSLGASGAWVGALTDLAPYQPLFLTIAVASLGAGFWLVYRRAAGDCETAMCEGAGRIIKRTLWVKGALWLGTALVTLSFGADFGFGLFA